jgi:catechol 2,3-dioxygenase-like lactoylglutathione lyase family enzyme
MRVLAGCELVAFVPTTDPERARRFYGEILGLPLISETPIACVFRARKTLLRVTAVKRHSPAPYTVLGWIVPNIAKTVGQLRDRGVRFRLYEGMDQDELGIWSAPDGARVAWLIDPDGNTLSVTEL